MEHWCKKVAIVTGASSGIGEAIAKALVKNGMYVIALARREEKLKELESSLEKFQGFFYPIKCDVRKEDDILKAFAFAEAKFGGVDVLINNAGIGCFETITDGSTENMRAILEVNVLAPAIATKEAVRSIRKRNARGHIININSVLGRNAVLTPMPFSLYQASKFALHAMTQNVRQEMTAQKNNIKITGIYPGLVKTEIIELSGGSPNLYEQYPYVRSEDIADSVIFALSAKANVQIDELMVTPIAI